MRKVTKDIIRQLLAQTPPSSKNAVQKAIKAADLDSIKQDKKLQAISHYIEALAKHKQYLQFFEIGVVRDQKKKIENVAKYVGLAIRDYSVAEMDAKMGKQHNKQVKMRQEEKGEINKCSDAVVDWVNATSSAENAKVQPLAALTKQTDTKVNENSKQGAHKQQ